MMGSYKSYKSLNEWNNLIPKEYIDKEIERESNLSTIKYSRKTFIVSVATLVVAVLTLIVTIIK